MAVVKTAAEWEEAATVARDWVSEVRLAMERAADRGTREGLAESTLRFWAGTLRDAEAKLRC